MEDDAKGTVFREALHRHFKCTQLSTGNLVKISRSIIERKSLKIDVDALSEVMTSNDVDGRMFDKSDPEHFQNMGSFSKRFKSFPDCYGQHIRMMYRLTRKWQYVEPVAVQMAESKDDGKADDIEADDEAEVIYFAADRPPDVYEIGKPFYFWNSHRKHPDFVAPKYENMKEEVLESPLLSGLMSIESWNALTASIEVLMRCESALRMSSNGQSEYMYSLKKREPVDANHLRALKLYTDFTDLCSKFCAILRWADPAEIAEIAHWTRSLIEMVQCFGSSLNEEAVQKTYFRGVNRTFIFKMIATRFHLPLSTTSDVKNLNIF